MKLPHQIDRMMTALLEAGHRATLEQLPGLMAEHAPQAGLDEVLIYLADLQQSTLRRLLSPGAGPEPDDPPAELRIDSTYGGRAFREMRILHKPGESGVDRWWAPLMNGAERLGVLCVHARIPHEEAERAIRRLASLLALIICSRRSYSDIYPRLVRSRSMNVAAEMLWHLMPPLTFSDAEVTISGVMEPAYEIGGDAFDYAMAENRVHLSIFDAMGHDLAAGLAANLAMTACRNHRREGMDLAGNSEAIEALLLAEFGDSARYLTAILADFDLRTGLLTWVNRGHHPPVLIRGGRWVSTLECPPAHPLGFGLELPVTTCHEQLEPGDRLLLYTDGIIEAGGREGEEFGTGRFVDFIIRHSTARLPVPETLRRLIKDILAYHDGRLHDDATVLLFEWHGPRQR
ncbi:serine phosphatase RsbU (regulator of sigma subunit) [Nonomuraea polychroma]|uniref:Serine phosphatase RsbU (Regulator of sigma subunit) n=1 Tax=Nonomuraea polychroma TaxID=46176 RepID=A0A438LYC6_9ACTN|nr:SpoIIE family protein phosphatase [Nonomuraea polychroma]RVX38347.1 serine phosphatase RsbU (regulator of sigma subunit) [Nonomuraea polychroma]